MKSGVGGSKGTGHVGCWRMRSVGSLRKHFMLVLNHEYTLEIRPFHTHRRVQKRQQPKPFYPYSAVIFIKSVYFKFLNFGSQVKRVIMCLMQGPVDDLECTEISPEHTDTTSPSHQSKLNRSFSMSCTAMMNVMYFVISRLA